MNLELIKEEIQRLLDNGNINMEDIILMLSEIIRGE